MQPECSCKGDALMGKFEKEIERLRSLPKDYTFSEARSLLGHLGFTESNKGKTSGSRVKFFRKTDDTIILLHKPHHGDVMKMYAVKDLLNTLKGKGDI